MTHDLVLHKSCSAVDTSKIIQAATPSHAYPNAEIKQTKCTHAVFKQTSYTIDESQTNAFRWTYLKACHALLLSVNRFTFLTPSRSSRPGALPKYHKLSPWRPEASS